MLIDSQHFDLFGKVAFQKAVVKPPFRLIADMSHEACLYYVISGSTKVYAPTYKSSIRSSEGLLMRCGTYINEYLKGETDQCEAIGIHFYPEVLKMLYEKEIPAFLLSQEPIVQTAAQHIKASLLLSNYMNSLVYYFENPELVSEELLKLKLKECILLLAKTDNADAIKALIQDIFTPLKASLKDTIEKNLFNNLSIEELASLSGMSLSTFKREFGKNYNCPPAKYIRERKLEQAGKLLKATGLRISDICYDCGFSDLAHFSKSFQKHYGQSPSSYRIG